MDRKEVGGISALVGFALGSLCGIGMKYYVDSHSFREEDERANRIVLEYRTENVQGGPEPETYVEWNGVRCYLRIDGKDISDLVRE